MHHGPDVVVGARFFELLEAFLDEVGVVVAGCRVLFPFFVAFEDVEFLCGGFPLYMCFSLGVLVFES